VPLHEEPSYEPGAVVSHVSSFDLARHLPADAPEVLAQTRGLGPNVYPSQQLLPGFAADVAALYDGTSAAASLLFRAFADALALPPDSFSRHFSRRSRGTMRLMCYPGAASPASAQARNVGIGAHTDFEAHTLLHADAPGLQLQLPHTGAGAGASSSAGPNAASAAAADASWRAAPVPDAAHFTVILGDVMERWTNGTLRATPHRVAHVPWARTSLVRFVGIDGDATVAPLPAFGAPRYAAVSQAEHLDAAVAAAEVRRDEGIAAGIIPARSAHAAAPPPPPVA
jgi:isopenicillin N synthase-like dioxygenase